MNADTVLSNSNRTVISLNLSVVKVVAIISNYKPNNRQ